MTVAIFMTVPYSEPWHTTQGIFKNLPNIYDKIKHTQSPDTVETVSSSVLKEI